MSGLIATKIGMSRIFQEDGNVVPVTYLKVQPNTVVRTKTEDKDGYNAVVLGVNPRTWKTKKGEDRVRYRTQKEWRVETLDGLEPGKEVSADAIPAESVVTVTGTSKGKGFQGVVKRHGFAGGPKSHGSHFHRRPGSIGMAEFPGRVQKGMKMAGHTGHDTVTLRNRTVVSCDLAEGVIAVKGPLPGPNGAVVYLTLESTPQEA